MEKVGKKIIAAASKYTKLSDGKFYKFGKCPFCGKINTFLLDINKDIFICPGCGKAGNSYYLISELENKSYFDIFDKKKNDKFIKERETLYQIYKIVADYFHKRLMDRENKGYSYLKNRNITENSMKIFKIGFCDRKIEIYKKLKSMGYSEDILDNCGLFGIYENSGLRYCRFANRVIFPIFDELGRVVGFGGRVLDNKTPKYLNSSESLIFSKASTLYGLNFAKNTNNQTLIVCEGFLDVISMHQAGFNNTVAPLGTAFTHTHADLIKQKFNKVILMQDSDEAGSISKIRTAKILKDKKVSVFFTDLFPCKDPDEFLRTFSKSDLMDKIHNAMTYIQYITLLSKRNYNRSDAEEYQSYINDITSAFLTQ